MIDQPGSKVVSRLVSRGMIARDFSIPLDQVEELSIKEYRLMRFTVFNAAALEAGFGGFRFQTDEEEVNELVQLADHYKKMGVF